MIKEKMDKVLKALKYIILEIRHEEKYNSFTL